MEKQKSAKFLYLCLSLLSVFPLYLFYVKYVPLVKAFQIVLLPVLAAVVLATALNLSCGLLLFVFLFPLINGLPYFFGISEHTPHAPTALVVCLFFLWGWLINRGIRGPRERIKTPIDRPLFFFAAAVVISGIVTFFKFSNFFPFRSDGVYELLTNVGGVSAGGALMSALFASLNYLTGILFFLIAVSCLREEGFAAKILRALLCSAALAALFGLYQHLFDSGFGNTGFWDSLDQINATFKDPNSFGLFLAALLPLTIGVALTLKGSQRAMAFCLSALILFIFPEVGMRSGFLALVAALLLFSVLAVRSSADRIKPLLKRKKVWLGAGLLAVIIAGGGYWGLRHTRLFDKIRTYTPSVFSIGGWEKLSPERYFLWREALDMMGDYPVSGVGMGSYIIELPNYYSRDQQENGSVQPGFKRIDSAENYFLQVGAEMGLVGVFFALWMFGSIAVLAKKAVQEAGDKPGRFVIFGIAAGVLVYFINLLFHSFIGAFEVHYLFWLGTAGLFVSGDPAWIGRKKSFVRKVGSVLAVGLLVIFGAVYLWQSSHSLSLKSRTQRFGIQQNFGLYAREKTADGRTFQWSGKTAGLSLTVEKPVVKIPLLASHPDISEKPLGVEIYLVEDFFKKRRLLDKLSFSENRWQTFRYDLSEAVGRPAMILFKVSRTWSPLKTSGIPDARRLGLAVGTIQFE